MSCGVYTCFYCSIKINVLFHLTLCLSQASLHGVEYPPTTEQSSTPCTVLGPAWHVVGSTKSAQVLNFDNRDFKQQRFMGGNGIGLP